MLWRKVEKILRRIFFEIYGKNKLNFSKSKYETGVKK